MQSSIVGIYYYKQLCKSQAHLDVVVISFKFCLSNSSWLERDLLVSLPTPIFLLILLVDLIFILHWIFSRFCHKIFFNIVVKCYLGFWNYQQIRKDLVRLNSTYIIIIKRARSNLLLNQNHTAFDSKLSNLWYYFS